MREWIRLASERSVVRRAAMMSVIVGTILTVINQGDILLNGGFGGRQLLKMGLTYLVPYCVSTISSVGASRHLMRQKNEA